MKALVEFVSVNIELVREEALRASNKFEKYSQKLDGKRLQLLADDVKFLKILESCEFENVNEELVNKILSHAAYHEKCNSLHLIVRDLAFSLSGKSMPQYNYFAR